MVQLRRRKIVVFDGVAGAEYVQIFESPDFVQRFPLYVPRQRRGKSVEIIFVGRFAFGLQKELVLILVGKGPELVFDAGTIAGTYSFDRSVEQRRTVETGAQQVVHFGRSVDQKARQLMLNRLCIR